MTPFVLSIVYLYFLIHLSSSLTCKYGIIDNKVRYYDSSNLVFSINDTLILNLDTDTAKFNVIGDWGGKNNYPYTTTLQRAVSYVMSERAALVKSNFQLTLGDNFYDNGVSSLNDIRFQRSFENAYESRYLQTPWFNLLGNHDYQGNVDAQIQYTRISKRWILPNKNYAVDVKINRGSNSLIRMIVIDTIQLCSSNSIQSEMFIENELKKAFKSSVPYIILAGHESVWSVINYDSNECLINKLRPLMHHYRVSLYISGHSHSFQHFSDTYLDTRVDYVITGSGAYKYDRVENRTSNPLPLNAKYNYYSLDGGFTYIEANNNQMVVTFTNSTGQDIYKFFIYPNKK